MSKPERNEARESLTPPLELPPNLGRLLAIGIVAVALIGFITGTRSGASVTDESAHVGVLLAAPEGEDDEGALPPAPRHADLARDDLRRTDARQIASFAHLLSDRRGLTATVELDEASRAEDLAARARLRAYDGAPPRIPHAIAQMTRPDCMACHDAGLRVADHIAPAMSHEPFANCTQCHVVDGAPMPGGALGLESAPPWETDFVGLEAPDHGPRVWDGAPPVIPHPTRMRERCASCHGVLAEGLASSHPWRASCTQCHAPSAAFDQVPTGGVGPAIGETP